MTLILLFSVIFLPDIPIYNGFNVRIDDVIILFSFFYLLYKQVLYNTYLVKIMLLICIIMFISIGLNDRLLSVNSLEFYNKIIKGLVTYNVCLLYLQNKNNYKVTTSFLIVSILFLIIINLMQFINTHLIHYFFEFYNNTSQMDSFERRASYTIPRITGLMGNPNNNATLFLFFTGFLLAKYFANPQRRFLILMVFTVIVILFTQSRTIFLTTGIFLLITIMVSGNSLILLFVISILTLFTVLDIPYLSLIFKTRELSQTKSVTGRVDEWVVLLDMIKQQPIWGYGGYKEYFYETQTYPESEYILGWFRYGGGYLLTYLSMFIYFNYTGIKYILKKIPNGYLLLGTNLAMTVGSTSNTPFNNPRIFIFYMFILAFFEAGLIHDCDLNFNNNIGVQHKS